MIDSLSADAIAALDPGNMLGDVLAQPLQIGDALWRAESAGVPRADMPGGLLVCGMGGSAIGGDLAAAALGDRATRPIRTVRGYEIESWTLPDTLVLCASYSGDTEETLACFEAAGAAGAQRVALTTGGRLAEAARAEGVPVIGVPSGMKPRAAVLYGLIATLECAALCGAAPGLHSEIDTATGLLERLAAEWGPGAPPDSQAKALRPGAQGHRADRPRRRADDRRRPPLAHADQRERRRRVVLLGAARGRAQRDLRLAPRARSSRRCRRSSCSIPISTRAWPSAWS